MFGSGTKTLLFPNQDVNDTTKITTSVKDSDLLINGITETVENEVKEQKGDYLGMLAAKLGISFLGNMLAAKGVLRAGEGTIRAGQDF